MSEEPLTWEDLPDADQAATGDGRVVAWAINRLTLEINALRLALAPPTRTPVVVPRDPDYVERDQ